MRSVPLSQTSPETAAWVDSNASTSASSARSDGPRRPTGPAVEVLRARFLEGATPVAGSEIVPYVLLREVESGKQYEAPADHPNVLYRWLRGPTYRRCRFHSDRQARYGDVRCGQEYCCLECLHRGRVSFPSGPPSTRWELQRTVTRDLGYDIVGNEKSFVPTMSDVNRFFRLEITGNAGVPVALVTTPVIQPPQATNYRRWVGETYHPGFSAGGQPFRVLNWNILARMYATEQEYPYVPPHVLSWGYRKHLIVQEIVGHRPDIVALQEVEQHDYEETLLPALMNYGYDGVYLEKNRVVFTNKYTNEGCAILYRRERFAFVERIDLDFNALAQAALGESQPAQLTRLLKGNVALLVILEDRIHGGQVCAANTHIIASPEHTDVKLWQADALLRTLDSELAARQRSISTVLCGDFNSDPGSAVYHLYNDGAVPRGHPELQDPHGLLAGLGLTHRAAIKSAYRAVLGHEAPYTNWATRTGAPTGGQDTLTLDYVWYDARLLRPTAALEVLPPQPLPNRGSPSDHVPLVVDFCLRTWE